ncbi:MarR family transcriptional regulator [Streptococcus chenjunshii]|uniref:MarR family transcriptional regulator n=1 Tax=Streptococcus chenjunshii TaxID=2173853 RepID=A0A372KJA6_9STRE|nr:MarR family transcriptional regulator [Streptococcus chenjunshii]AXQ77888.1 MarR family transcriptional regulator [Streptococcus chenjunshii]RFU50202.1 MarR family transcriptional regulator [Streptococcus chenjunshii]RFU52381.1 MarR family transcriptional regulator [Streptococcus chenjunshii]
MELNTSLGYLLNISAKLIKRNLDLLLKDYNLTSSQWAVLKLLSSENHLSQADIAEKTNTDRATCGAVIDKLIAKQMVYKSLSSNDRRSYIVSLSSNTGELVNHISHLAEQTNHQALQGFSADEQKQLIAFLHTIIKNLEKI